jgi:hypothetical protein
MTVHPPPCTNLIDNAISSIANHHWAVAAELYGRLLEANTYSASHWFNYSYALYKLGRYQEAIHGWERSIELGFGWDNRLWSRDIWLEEWWKYLGPKINLPWYMTARAQCASGLPEAAVASLRKAVAGGFSDDDALFTEPDLACLRDDARYAAELRRLANVPPPNLSRDDRWRFDLDCLVTRLEQIHFAPYRCISRRRLRDWIRRLKASIPNRTDHEITLEIARIVAAIGDGHTALHWHSYAMPDYPIELRLYSDGLFVYRAPKAWADAVGGRVTRIGRKSAEQMLKDVEPYCSADNAMGYRKQAPSLTVNPYVLHALGMVRDIETDHIPLTVEGPKGNRVTIDLRRDIPTDAGWVTIRSASTAPLPLAQRGHGLLWFEPVPEAGMVYCQCNGIADPGNETFGQFFERLISYIDENGADYLAIDLRGNPGGDSGKNRSLIHALIRCPRINRRGHLFVLIGRHTFSAAQNLTSYLERETEAIFVGEPSGSRPNFTGQDTMFKLPCSELMVSCSSLYHQGGMVSCDFRQWVEPDIVAEMSSQDAANNRDPAFEAVLQEIQASRVQTSTEQSA